MTTRVGGKAAHELTKLELWEQGRRKLGYGDWTPDNPQPFQKWAGLEAHKLSLVMIKRNISNAEFLLCVNFCQRHHKRIENAVWVFRWIGEAKAEQAVLNRSRDETSLESLIEQAIGYEKRFNDSLTPEWISKLTRARGHYREEVLREWDQARKP